MEVENVRVVVRVRPLDENERQQDCQDVVAVDKQSRAITVLKPGAGPGEPPKVYYFDNVFDQDSSQVRSYPVLFVVPSHEEGKLMRSRKRKCICFTGNGPVGHLN